MQKPEIPKNEKERLKEVERYNLTEELSNESLESIVEIASEICQMPITLMSIVDQERQFFKVAIGVDAKETSRDVSFCAHAINRPEDLLIVEDASKDERFSDNPLVVGEPFIRFYAGIPILSPDNYPLGTVCVIDNKPNRLSENQKNALRHLGKQVTLILELQKKNQLLEKAEVRLRDQAKDMEDYAHIVSHDLKEPVRNIKSFLELFNKKYGHELNDEGEKYIDFALNGALKVNQLIEDLLDFSKTGRITEDFKPVELNKVINNVLESINFQILERKAEINVSNTLPVIKGIESGLTQLFYNLINNSLKFVPNGRTPIIDISSIETEANIIIKLKDNGIGIPESQLNNIFNIFRRVTTTQTFPGTGIGLAIVKKIVTIHDARIEVKSEEGNGSEFILYFPK
jgi:signal transduction histidine kinase